MNIFKGFWKEWSPFFKKNYWHSTNTLEWFAFTTKLAIIIPGLLWAKQWWWLYIFAEFSAFSLIITSIKKKLPTIIYFNVMWVILATMQILKHFYPHIFKIIGIGN
jgi:hypothetical protein